MAGKFGFWDFCLHFNNIAFPCPGRLYFRDAGGQGGVSWRSSGFDRQVQQDVIGKTVKLETMGVDYVTKEGDVKDKEEGTKD